MFTSASLQTTHAVCVQGAAVLIVISQREKSGRYFCLSDRKLDQRLMYVFAETTTYSCDQKFKYTHHEHECQSGEKKDQVKALTLL